MTDTTESAREKALEYLAEVERQRAEDVRAEAERDPLGWSADVALKNWQQVADELRADRDRLLAVEKAQDAVRDALIDERDRLAGEVQAERETSAGLRGHMYVMEQEIARLTSELAAARENEARYLWLKDNAYEWPTGECCALDQQERAALWLLNMEDDIDASIDAARRAGEGEK